MGGDAVPSMQPGAGASQGVPMNSSCVITIIYRVCATASAQQSRPHWSLHTDAARNPRLFFCERMSLSFAPDSCAGSLFRSLLSCFNKVVLQE